MTNRGHNRGIQKGKHMNFRKKITILGAAVCCTCIGVAGSATYAWFAARDDISFSEMAFEVRTTTPALYVTYHSVDPWLGKGDGTYLTSSRTNEVNLTKNLYEVTSKYGEAFYKHPSEDVYELYTGNDAAYKVNLHIKSEPFTGVKDLAVSVNVAEARSLETKDTQVVMQTRVGVIQKTDATFETETQDGIKQVFGSSLPWQRCHYYDPDTDAVIENDETYNPLVFGDDIILGTVGNDATNHFYLSFAAWFDGLLMYTNPMSQSGRAKITIRIHLVDHVEPEEVQEP